MLQCRDFELEAELRWGPQRKPKLFALSSDDGLVWPFPAGGSYVPPELAMFVQASKQPEPKNADSVSMTTLVPAFVLSELKTAFIIGFIIFIPFLVIDLIVSSSLMSMGMMMLPPVLVSLPFKILLFVLVDGWALIVRSLLTSFH